MYGKELTQEENLPSDVQDAALEAESLLLPFDLMCLNL